MKPRRLLFILLLANSWAKGADPYPIQYLGIEQGLSNNAVTCIFQDHNGFMWFGTYDGLNRYDGYDFRVFRNKFDDTNSLANNRVTAITEDKHNNLWIGTTEGISLYNGLTSKLLPAYYFPYQSKSLEKIKVPISNLQSDEKGNIFIGTEVIGLLMRAFGRVAADVIPIINGKEAHN